MTTGAQEKIPGYDYDYGGALLNVKHIDIGATGDGVTDDTSAIQAAIDLASTRGGGKVFLPKGTYLCTQLELKSYVSLVGEGWSKSVLKQKGATALDFIVLAFTSTEFVLLKDLKIDGNKANQATANNGIFFNNTAFGGTSNDSRHRIENVWINSCKGSGILIGGSVREMRVMNVWVRQNDEYGITTDVLGGTDNWFNNITAEANGLSGYNVNGYGCIWTNCKSFGNGAGGIAANSCGFLISGFGTTMTNCWAQENPGRGFHFFGAQFFVGSELMSDSNGAESFYFSDAADKIRINSCFARNQAGLAYHPTWGVSFDGTQTSCYVELMTDGAMISGIIDETNLGTGTFVDYIQDSHIQFGTFISQFDGDGEHIRLQQPGGGALLNAFFSFKTFSFGGAIQAKIDAYNGATSKQLIRFDFENGRIYVGEDSGVAQLVLATGTTGQRPAFGVAGRLYFNTTTVKFQGDTGAAWVDLN